MPTTGSGHMPENLAMGAALSSLSFFCTAVMSALVKATRLLDGDRFAGSGRQPVPDRQFPATPPRGGNGSKRAARAGRLRR